MRLTPLRNPPRPTSDSFRVRPTTEKEKEKQKRVASLRLLW
jgi:hypothetical protein